MTTDRLINWADYKMAVWLKNFQSRVPIREALLKMQSCFLLNAIGCARYDVSIVCTTDEEVQHLNNVYRNINRPTDILSFPYHEVNAWGLAEGNWSSLLYRT